jgi:hypothetical protein
MNERGPDHYSLMPFESVLPNDWCRSDPGSLVANGPATTTRVCMQRELRHDANAVVFAYETIVYDSGESFQ